MMKRLWRALNEPFPDVHHPGKMVITAFLVGIFITLFLYLLQPFGLSQYQGSKFLLSLGFGLVTFVTAIGFELLVTYVLRIRKDLPNWTLLKWMIEAMALVIVVAIGNYAYTIYFFDAKSWHWFNFFEMIRATVLVGIFPIIFSGLWTQLRAIKKNQAMAQQFPTGVLSAAPSTTTLHFNSKNKKQTLELLASQIYYIESQQNYVSICYREGDLFKKETLRNTIANIEQVCHSTPILRCHRSFLVHINKITEVDGNAQGLRLRLDGLAEVEIPVSRKYISSLKSQLKEGLI